MKIDFHSDLYLNTPGRSRDSIDRNEYGNEYEDGNEYHQVDGIKTGNDTTVVSHNGGRDDSLSPLLVRSSDILQSGSDILFHYPINDEDSPDLNGQAEQAAGTSASNSLGIASVAQVDPLTIQEAISCSDQNE